MQVVHSSTDSARRYAGPERREYQRIPVGYPICVRYSSSSGETVERFAQTKDVSVDGVLYSCAEPIETGTKVDIRMGIPSAYAASLPAAQLNGEGEVVRCEPVDPLSEDGYGARIALRFTAKLSLSTEVSMFD